MKPLIKKILIVSHYYPPHIGGIEIVAYNQAKYLAAAGHTVTVLTSALGGTSKNYEQPNVKVVRVPALNFLEKHGVPFPIFSLSLIPKLYREIKKVDIVHVHDSFYINSFYAAVIAYILKKPIVLMQHVAMINHKSSAVVAIQKVVYNTTAKLIFKLASVIIVYNDRVANFLISKGVPASKIIASKNGVDTDVFNLGKFEDKKMYKEKFGLDTTKKTILFVGRYVHKKGFDKVIAIRNPDYQIAFAGGDTPEGIFNDVKFLGKLSQTQLAEVYKAADLFLLPSESEGFPLSIQESMASGLPVITSYDIGYVNYNLDPKLLFLLNNPSIEDVKTAVNTVINDDEQLEKMAAYSRVYALANFSWPVAINKFDEIYSKLLNK